MQLLTLDFETCHVNGLMATIDSGKERFINKFIVAKRLKDKQLNF